MHVIATAGHVDHGKSSLIRALTGTDPDRLSEEHRRGLSIELGYCWTSLPMVGDVAFVDVPGHERFIATMLSGIGPVPAVLFVVAADDPWMPQAAEHLSALDALGVRHGVVGVTRSDLADPAPASARVASELSRTSLRGSPIVSVSARSGAGLGELQALLVAMLGAMPAPDTSSDIRLWIDRKFSIKGAGTVVTGTMPVGRICVGDSLAFEKGRVRVRGVQTLDHPVTCAAGLSRVALNVTGDDLAHLDRGGVLVTPHSWHFTDVVDVRVRVPGHEGGSRIVAPPQGPLLHIGATSVATHCRPLAADLLRLRLVRPLPLRIGDRALLRDPGSRTVWGVTVLDPAPPSISRRGAAAERSSVLASVTGEANLSSEVDRRSVVHTSTLERIGVPAGPAWHGITAGGWLMSEAKAAATRREVDRLVSEHARRSPLEPGVPLVALAERLGLPSAELVRAVVSPPLHVREGRVVTDPMDILTPALERAVASVHGDLASDPFLAPTSDRLHELGLDHRAVAAAVKAGRLLRVSEGIVLLPGADSLAAQWLTALPQPFTTSQARMRLGTSRRVVLPLLAHLDKLGRTRRLPDDRRVVLT